MVRNGSQIVGLLHDLHADDCDGTEFTTCRPVVISDDDPQNLSSTKLEVVFMAWCGDCGAADWDWV